MSLPTGAASLRLETSLGGPRGDIPVGIPAPRVSAPLRIERVLVPDRPRAPAPVPRELQGLIATVKVNEQDKGEHIAYMTADGRFYLRRETVEGWMRLPRDVPGTDIEGEAYVLLDAIASARVTFDETSLVLKLAFNPDSFPGQVLAYQSSERPAPTLTNDLSAIFNYQVGQSDVLTGTGSRSWNASADASVRLREWLLRSQAYYNEGAGSVVAARGLTALSRDDPARRARLTIGDFNTGVTDVTGGVTLGGIAYTSAYDLDPYFVHQPTASFRTAVEVPSQLDVYIGETRIFRQAVAPGPLELTNLSYLAGRRDIRIVVRDIFGRERDVSMPFYFTDRGLAAGLHDFSYAVGTVRRNITSDSADYGEAAFSAYHRFGVNDWLTLGGQAEGTRDFAGVGPALVLRSDRLGVLSLEAIASRHRERGENGYAASVSYAYQRGPMSVLLSTRKASPHFASLQTIDTSGLSLHDHFGTVSYTFPHAGTFTASLRERQAIDQLRTRTGTIGYFLPLTRKWLVQATYQKTTGVGAGYEFFMGLQYTPEANFTGFASMRTTGDVHTGAVQFGSLLPDGEGIGYSVSAEASSTPDGPTRTLSPEFTYNGRYASVQASASQAWARGGNTGVYDVSVRGAVAYAGGGWGLSRPIDDAFAVARVDPPIPGVRVYLNQQEMGRTDGSGNVFLPRLISYVQNHISVDDRDVPIDRTIEEKGRDIVPFARAGTLVSFKMPVTRSFSGNLRYRSGTRIVPAEFVLVTLKLGGKVVEFPTGRDGAFYFENVPPGRHVATVQLPGETCDVAIEIPATEEPVTQLPDVVACDAR